MAMNKNRNNVSIRLPRKTLDVKIRTVNLGLCFKFAINYLTSLMFPLLSGPSPAWGESRPLRQEFALQDHGRGDVRHLRQIWSHPANQSVSSCPCPIPSKTNFHCGKKYVKVNTFSTFLNKKWARVRIIPDVESVERLPQPDQCFNFSPDEFVLIDPRFSIFFCSGNTPETRGTAFVVYEDIFDAKNACDHLSGFNVCNRYLVVLYYQANKAFKKLDAEKKEAELNVMKQKYGLNTPGREKEVKWKIPESFVTVCFFFYLWVYVPSACLLRVSKWMIVIASPFIKIWGCKNKLYELRI